MNYGEMNEVPNIHLLSSSLRLILLALCGGSEPGSFCSGPRRAVGSALGYRVAACAPSSL